MEMVIEVLLFIYLFGLFSMSCNREIKVHTYLTFSVHLPKSLIWVGHSAGVLNDPFFITDTNFGHVIPRVVDDIYF